MTDRPNKEGFFWGRWHTPCAGTADDGDMCGGVEWQVHQVVEYWEYQGRHFFAVVPGVEKFQPLDAFEWGEEVVR